MNLSKRQKLQETNLKNKKLRTQPSQNEFAVKGTNRSESPPAPDLSFVSSTPPVPSVSPPEAGNNQHEYQPAHMEPLRLADLVLYPDSYEAYCGPEKVKLRRKEYQLLEFFMRNQHRVINRHTLLEYIWNYHSESLTNTLDVHIASLRKKIDRKRSRKFLQTIHGSGYKLSDH